MDKYFKSSEGTKIKISGDKAYVKTSNGENEIKHPSTLVTNIIIENIPISKVEYEK